MTISLTGDHILSLRLRSQLLLPQALDGASNVSQIVQSLCAIQAQEEPSAALAIRARSAGLVAADIERARVEERSIVRTWGPRGTLHFLPTEDLGWLLSLLGPVFIAGDRRRRAELGLDEDTCTRAIHLLRDILASHGPLTRAEIVEQLAIHGLYLQGQARPHLLARAALEGVICFGPSHGNEPTYVLLNDWFSLKDIPPSLSEDAAHVELTRRYLRAYAPTRPEDQSAWSGLSLSKTRAAWQSLANELLEVTITGTPAWMLKTQATWLDEMTSNTSALVVRLLPRYDIYLLGYQNRDLAVPREFVRRVNAGGGIVHPVVLVNGCVVGIWKSQLQKKLLNVRVEPFVSLPAEVHAAVEAEVADIGRFLGVDGLLQVM